uniref:Uncharacterized protein n=1 Tax=Mesocestoides corti TaxID=53468 RepID=A0A5K3ELJ9_MESCO
MGRSRELMGLSTWKGPTDQGNDHTTHLPREDISHRTQLHRAQGAKTTNQQTANSQELLVYKVQLSTPPEVSSRQLSRGVGDPAFLKTALRRLGFRRCLHNSPNQATPVDESPAAPY